MNLSRGSVGVIGICLDHVRYVVDLVIDNFIYAIGVLIENASKLGMKAMHWPWELETGGEFDQGHFRLCFVRTYFP